LAQAESPLGGALPTLQMLTPSIPKGSISNIGRNAWNDRDVGEANRHASALTVPFVESRVR
jgi:hypothetical protein